MSNQQIINTTAGEVQTILRQHGLSATDPITVTIPIAAQFASLTAARAQCRALVEAAGLTEDDIDTLIKDARREVAAEGQ